VLILSIKRNFVFANQFLFYLYAESSIQDGGICQGSDKMTRQLEELVVLQVILMSNTRLCLMIWFFIQRF